MSSTFGQIYRCTTFGESHGGAVGVVIDGCPAGYKISTEAIQAWLNRRRPGQSHLSTPRGEPDQVEIVSGLLDNVTLGTPITMMVRNKDARSDHYNDLKQVYRPSHADYTTDAKYGIRSAAGGGRASARETIGRVAAAAIAEQILQQILPDFEIVGWVDSVKDIKANIEKPEQVTRIQCEGHPLRCPDEISRKKMEKIIIDAKKNGDSVGGTIFCGIKGVPPGLGEPVFDKLEADLAKSMLSLPACKGFESGLGFAATLLFGSEHNDPFIKQEGQIRTTSNHSGGIQGGISNGEYIYIRTAFKPVATIFKSQQSVTKDGEETTVKPKAGRHDPCVLPRAVPMVEAMAILTIMDHFLRQQAIAGSKKKD